HPRHHSGAQEVEGVLAPSRAQMGSRQTGRRLAEGQGGPVRSGHLHAPSATGHCRSSKLLFLALRGTDKEPAEAVRPLPYIREKRDRPSEDFPPLELV